jgi:hypothetical protein
VSFDDGRLYPPEEAGGPDEFVCYECMIKARVADETKYLRSEVERLRTALAW